jgi:hypothetical protein
MLGGLFTEELDFVNHIAPFLPFSVLCRLREVNKLCRVRIVDVKTNRYSEILHACPWMAAAQPVRMRVPGFNANTMGRLAETVGMQWSFHAHDDRLLVVRAQQFGGVTVTFTTPAYPCQEHVFSQTLAPNFPINTGPRYRVATQMERNALVASGALDRRVQTAEICELTNDADAVLFADRNPGRMCMSIYARSDKRFLRHISGMNNSFPAFLIRPGEMWVVDSHRLGTVWYYGAQNNPPYSMFVGGCLFPAQVMAWHGQIAQALAALKGRSVNTVMQYDQTLLLAFVKYAAATDPEAVRKVNMLLDAGASTRYSDEYGELALEIAMDKGLIDVMETLLQRSAAIPYGMLVSVILRRPPAALAAIRLLVKHGVELNRAAGLVELNRTPLMLAADRCLIDVVRVLLECGADPTLLDDNQHTALNLVERMPDSRHKSRMVKVFHDAMHD